MQQAGLNTELAKLGYPVEAVVGLPAVESDDPIAALGAYNAGIATAVVESLARRSHPVLTGGTCTLLPGMIAGLQRALSPETRLGLLWLDAHGDFNTPVTTPSGMLGGMPVAVVAGLCFPVWREGCGMTAPLPTNRIMMVDVRNLDREEEALIRATDVHVVRYQEADALTRITAFAESVDALYVHIDADILDSSLQPNHPTAEPDGLDVEQTLAIVEAAVRGGTTVAVGLVSLNPDGPGGETSLASGFELLVGSLHRWLAMERTV